MSDATTTAPRCPGCSTPLDAAALAVDCCTVCGLVVRPAADGTGVQPAHVQLVTRPDGLDQLLWPDDLWDAPVGEP